MKVELMYFKPESGKFYTSGEYDSAFDEAWEIFHEVKGFRDAGRLPGLRAGATDFDVLVDIPNLYPALIKSKHRDIAAEVERMYGPHDRRFQTAIEIADMIRNS